jgi:hypothetical protein
MVDSKNLRIGCGRRRIFGPTGHGNLAQGYLWNRLLTRRALKSLNPGVADRITEPLFLTPLQHGGLQGKFTPGEPWAKVFFLAPSFRGAERRITGSSNAVFGLRPQELH